MCVCIVYLYCIVYCVAPVITDYRHLASDPGPGNESIHGEVVHKPTIDSLLPAQMRKHKVLTRLREKKHETRSIYVLETVPSPFPPREEHQGGFIQEKLEPVGQPTAPLVFYSTLYCTSKYLSTCYLEVPEYLSTW